MTLQWLYAFNFSSTKFLIDFFGVKVEIGFLNFVNNYYPYVRKRQVCSIGSGKAAR